MKREYEIKQLTRKQKDELILNRNKLKSFCNCI